MTALLESIALMLILDIISLLILTSLLFSHIRKPILNTTLDGEAGNTEPEEDHDLAYASTKAMGDADHEVSLFSTLLIV